MAELDAQSAEQICELLAQLSAGKTVLLASHQAQHLQWLDQVISLADGELRSISVLPSRAHQQELR